MADKAVNPDQSQALVVWRNPREILLLTLRARQFQLLLELPPIEKCPLANLNVTLQFLYFYADAQAIAKATLVLLSAEGGELMAAPFDHNGQIRLTVPKGVEYKFFIHHDQSPSQRVFDFDPAYLSAAGAPANLLPAWASRQSAIESQPDVRLHWGYPDFNKVADNPNKPQLEWLIYHVVSSYVPLEGGEGSIKEASLIVEAMLLNQHTNADLWRRLVLNRFGFALKGQSRILQGLVTYVHHNPNASLQELINILNAGGKGNAVDWLRSCSITLLPDAKAAVASHIDGLLKAIGAELQAIQQGAPQSSFNKEQAQVLFLAAQQVPKAANHVDGVVDPVIRRLTQLTQAHPALRTIRPAFERNVVRQVRRDYPKYVPIEVELPTWFEMRYCYADKSFVQKAKFQVRDTREPGAIIQERELPADAIGYVQLPAGPSYEFRFHADEAKFACTALEREPTVTPDTSTWTQQAVEGNLFAQGKKLVWKTDLKLSDYGSFAQEPSLSQLLLACVAAKGQPHRKAELALDDNAAEADKAADAAVAGLLRGLLYSDKANGNDVQNWWREISFHRLRAVRPADGSVLERLVALLHDRDDLKLDTVAAWLNTRGKGNVVAWLKETQGKLNNYRDEIAANLTEVISAFDGELAKLTQENEKISLPCRVMAVRLRERLKKLKPKDSLADAWTTAVQRCETLLSNEDSKKSLRVWTAAKIKDREQYQQKQANFPRREIPKPPEIPWLEVMFLYADGTPVKKAKYKLTGGDALLTGTLDDAGFAFEIGRQNKVYEYDFHDDPNNFSLAEGRKLKAKGADVGTNVVDYGIAEGVFKTGGVNLVRWGNKFYSSNEQFKQTPDLSQVINTVIRNKTPWIASEDDHKELTAFLLPLIMGKLLEKPDVDEVWKACSFQRLGGCVGENGVVARDLLWWVDQTADPPLLDAINRLNSLGNGNAYTYLKTLHGKFDEMEKSVSDNLGSILDAFALELDKLINANDTDVIPEMKRFAKEIKGRIQEAKGDIATKVKHALKTARDRLNVLQQKPQPEYKGAAPLMELTIRQQEKIQLAARPVAVAPKLAWFDLEYLHWDDKFVEEAEYVVTDESGNNVLYQAKLTDGYSHLVVPENFKFKYYFRRDKAFAVDPAKECKAIATFPPVKQQIANLTRNAMLLKKMKKVKLGWGDPGLTGSKPFYANPAVGAIACNVVRKPANSPDLSTGDEPQELAKLLHPILMRQPTNSVAEKLVNGSYKDNSELWIHVVLNRLSVLLTTNGQAVASILWAVHQGTVRQAAAIDAGASIKREAVLEMLNSMGKGNGIRWFENNLWVDNAKATLVKNNLDTIFDELIGEMDLLRKQGSLATAVTARRLQSFSTENYAKVIKDRLQAVKPTIQASVNQAFTTLNQELTAVMNQPRIKQPGTLNQVNLLKQKQTPIPARAFTVPRWIELQYLYEDGEPVPNAQYDLYENVTLKDTGNLDAASGFVYLTDVPDTVNTAAFKKEATVFAARADVANVPLWKKPEGRKNHTIPEPGFQSYGAGMAALGNFATNGNANWVYNTLYGIFYAGMIPPAFGWIDNTPGTAAPSWAGFQAYPSIRMLAAKAVQNNTSRCCNYKINGPPTGNQTIVFDKDPERIEAMNLLQPIVYSGNAALGAVNNDLVIWSALVMNRVGATNHGACISNESRLRKALLLEIGRTNPPLGQLVKLMNSVGKGHAVRWLRKLNNDRNDVKTGVVNALTAIITEIRTECNAGAIFTFGGNDLGPAVQPFYVATRANCANLLGGANIQNRVDAVLDPLFVRLANLLANRPLNPRPFPQVATLSQTNVFVQPAEELLEVQRTTPPFWNLGANVTTIQVQYVSAAGGNVTADYNVSNANVAQIAGTNGVRNFVIPAGGAADGVFFFKHDQGGLSFKPECKPFANPELPAALAAANYVANAAVHNPPADPSGFDGKNILDWGSTHITSAVDFRKNPTLGKMLAQAVIDGMPLVSGAGDVQDLTMALERLIARPAERTDVDAWFRAAVVALGGLADHGSVLKGVLLRFRKRKKMDPEEFFCLINFAAQNERNAVDWIDQQLITPPDPGNAAATLNAILTAFNGRLLELRNIGMPPGSANLQGFIDGLRLEVTAVQNLIAANVPNCFQPAISHFTDMRAHKLPLKRPLCVGLNVYQRPKADMFLESQQTLTQVDKENIDRSARQRISAGNVVNNPAYGQLAGGNLNGPYGALFSSNPPDRPAAKVAPTLHDFIAGTRGQSAKTLAPELANLNHQEFVERVEALPAPWVKQTTHWGHMGAMGTMTSYYNPVDGTLIRYKPGGDEYQRPPAPMYSIEVTHTVGGGAINTAEAMFKLDPNGNAVPWGPRDANNPYGFPSQQNSRYADDMSKAGHRPLRY